MIVTYANSYCMSRGQSFSPKITWVFMKPPRLLQTPVRLAAKDVSVALGTNDPIGDGVSLRDRDLLVLVGFTGAGKSTTLAALEGRGVLSAILPDRRELTDKVILPAMTGDPARRITDRLERFSLTAAFREKHPGGMGEVLEQISVPRALPDGLIVRQAGCRKRFSCIWKPARTFV